MPKPLTNEQENYLKQLYYDKQMKFGRDKLFKYVQLNNPELHISRRQIYEWLTKQEVHQLFFRTRKTKTIQATRYSKPFQACGCDLADLSSIEYDNYKYYIAVQDLYSKKIWVEPLKNKEAKSVANAMNKILQDMKTVYDNSPTILRTDNGSEFVAKQFQNVLKKYNVKSVFSEAGLPQSNGTIERLNGVIKRQLNMNMKANDTHDWVKILPTIVSNYNNTYNRSIKTTPNNLHDGKTELKEEVKVSQSLIGKNEKIKDDLLKVGDKVRLKLVHKKTEKKVYFWSDEIFTIYKVHKQRKETSRPYYYIKDDNGKEYTTKCYYNDLQVVDTDNMEHINKVQKYTVSKIKDYKPKNFTTHPSHLLVLYTNFKTPQWEPYDIIKNDVPKMVNNFMKRVRN